MAVRSDKGWSVSTQELPSTFTPGERPELLEHCLLSRRGSFQAPSIPNDAPGDAAADCFPKWSCNDPWL